MTASTSSSSQTASVNTYLSLEMLKKPLSNEEMQKLVVSKENLEAILNIVEEAFHHLPVNSELYPVYQNLKLAKKCVKLELLRISEKDLDLQSFISQAKIKIQTYGNFHRECYMTDLNKMSSQGLVTDPTGSFAYFHDTTIPYERYQRKTIPEDLKQSPSLFFEEGLEHMGGLNMDRGAVAKLFNGCICTCIADGVGGDRIYGMLAAQEITQEAMRELQEKPFLFTSSDEAHAIDLFNHLSRSPGFAMDAKQGSSTFVILKTQKTGNHFQVNGAAIGDSFALHIDMKTLRTKQLNVIERNPNIRHDTGGRIAINRISKKNPHCFSKTLSQEDLLILGTDGLLDNLSSIECIPLIICNSWFDTIPIDWEEKSLPSEKQLQELLEQHEKSLPSPEEAVIRLHHYLEWVVAKYKKIEAEIYSIQNYDEAMKAVKERDSYSQKPDDCLLIALRPKSF